LKREAEAAEVDRLEQLWRSRSCAAPGCGVAFTPSQVTQRFCSDRSV
jgi:hypothetical protein